ncbi:MAG TPA: YetF domain-containing protein [Chitinophagaceae bacterium]|nr:YetF domain-containing protein [Chitinophagaceae bacterium]
MLLQIDWQFLLFGKEDWGFLLEVILRSAIMFIVALAAMRAMGRRGTKQGVFELVLIVTLGSAAGDPSFYKDVGLLPAIMVFVVVVLMYKIVNFFTARSRHLDDLVEGTYARLIKDSRFTKEKLNKLRLDELFEDLRLKGVSHLGQVDMAYIEASGQLSVFFLPDEKVVPGLPVIPELFDKQVEEIKERAFYSCSECGHTAELQPASRHVCGVCGNSKWVRSIDDRRVK